MVITSFIHQLASARRHKPFRLSTQAAHLSTTHVGGFTHFLFIAERQAGRL